MPTNYQKIHWTWKIKTDGANVYPAAIADVTEKGTISKDVIHRISKYL